METAFWRLVVKTEQCWEWVGFQQKGYGIFKHRGRRSYAHRISMGLHLDRELDQSELVDHLCHNKACVNPRHLRIASHQENAANRAGAAKSSRTGVRGVSQDSGGRWRAQVRHEGVRFRRSFYSAAEAEEWVRNKRVELIGWD